MIIYNILDVGAKCSNNCRLCRYRYGNKKSFDEIKEIIGSFSSKDNLKIMGGEPALRKDIIDIVEYAKKQGFKRIMLHTNGKMLSYENFTSKVTKAGAYLFEIKLFGPNKEMNDRICEAESFEHTLKGVEVLRKIHNLNEMSKTAFIDIIVPIYKENFEHLHNIVAVLEPHNIDRFTFVLTDTEILMSQVVGQLKNAIDSAIESKIWPFSEGVPLCMMQGYEYHISEIYYPASRKMTKISVCKKCIYSPVCEGVDEEYLKKNGQEEFSAVKESRHVKDILNLKNEKT
ncbi:MAG: radical SAM protein [Nanoarchaeota archaeon]|nr:radical SAM protein [Nanoarchaeota archaeon]